MERISIQEIANILIEKSGLTKKDADLFVMTMFELVKEGLETDRLVKIKGLGTFKIIDIEARESVNVNTGERVVIEGHDKITFTPDATMKELVNKPFSQFETVALNEGVNFDDMEQTDTDTETETQAQTQTQTQTEEPVPELEPVMESPIETLETEGEAESVGEVESVDEAEPVDEANSEPIQEETADPTPEVVPEEELIEVEPTMFGGSNAINDDNDMEDNKKRYTGWICTILACLLSFATGYYTRDCLGPKVVLDEVAPEPGVAVVDSLAKDSVKATPAKSKTDTAKVEQDIEKLKAEKVETAQKEETPAETITSKGPETNDYEKMDPRVRYGAYIIVGLDHNEKVRAGDNISRISRRNLGPDMECYVEVYNNMSSSTELKEGQIIKIPKLELKKKNKKVKE